MGHEVFVYPHNDLLNLAHHHRQVIEEKVRHGSRGGIGLDCMSCLIALAFSVEAISNFVGAKTVPEWNERDSYRAKTTQLGGKLGFVFDDKVEPFETLMRIKTIRDQLAHGKPIESRQDESSREMFERAMMCPWDEYLDANFVLHAYEQVIKFKELLLTQAKIPLHETLTCGGGVWIDP